jgi:hypothetical protein
MDQKLEQLRRRYANPSPPPYASGAYILGPRSIATEYTEEQPTISDSGVDMHNSVSQGPAPVAALAEQNSKDGQPASEEPRPTDLARGVAELFEPARRYRNRVALSFEAIRALRAELDVLVQSVEQLKGLQDQIIEILDYVRAELADLAMSTETAKALRLQLSALVQTLDAGTELESQIQDLSRVLGAVFQAQTAKDKEPPEKTADEK